MPDIQDLRSSWTEHYSRTLPNMARARHAAQPRWPVTLDHCFARIILDNTVGEGKEQWDKRLKRPAVKNMTIEQLETAIGLAERVEGGEEDLVALDLQSLDVRGKASGKYPGSSASESKHRNSDTADQVPGSIDTKLSRKRKQSDPSIAVDAPCLAKRSKPTDAQLTLNFKTQSNPKNNLSTPPVSENEQLELSTTRDMIEQCSSLTPYRKRLYATLLSVPKGRYTTYAALADFLGSSARAVGNGMRNNPFAPEVPCHRVLASDGSIGGFGGSWGAHGKNANEKFELLRREGVAFDSKERVKGPAFKEFVNLLAGR